MNEKRKTELVNDRSTEIADNRSTEIVNERSTEIVNDRSTKVVNDRFTEVIDDRSTEVVGGVKREVHDQEDLTYERTKIDAGDIVNGYKIGRILSEISGEADVHLCEKDGKTYVAKIYKTGREIDKTIFEEIINSKSKYLLLPIEIGEIKGRFYEIQPYYKNGTLFDKMDELTVDYIKNVVVKEVNQGLMDYHKMGFVHNDIKPHNIFIKDDNKSLVIGDFGITKKLGGREYGTSVSAQTTLYSAPEQGAVSSPLVDYYAFGMTLLHLALKEDPFYGVSNHEILKYKMMNSIKISEEVDEDLGDLIFGLLIREPKERFNSKHILNWINDNKTHKMFRKSRELKDDTINFDRYTFSVGNKRQSFYNAYDLSIAMLQNIEEAMKHFSNNVVSHKIAEVDQDFAITLSNVFREYEHTKGDKQLEGLYKYLYTLEPNLPFIIEGKVFENFHELIVFLEKEYPKKHSVIINEVLYPMFYKRHASVIIERIDEIHQTYETFENRYDAFLTTFSQEGSIYNRGIKYKDLSSFTSILFKEFKPVKLAIESPLFYELLELNFDVDKDELNKIQATKDLFKKYTRLSYILKGAFPFVYKRNNISTIKDIVDYLIKAYHIEDETYKDTIRELIKEEKFYYLNELENSLDSEVLTNMKQSLNPLLELLYSFSEEKIYRGASSVTELVKMLENANDIVEASNELIYDPDFEIWLKYLGYEI